MSNIKINVPVNQCLDLIKQRHKWIIAYREQKLELAIQSKMTELTFFWKKQKYPTRESAIAALQSSKNYQGWWDSEYEAIINSYSDTQQELIKLQEMLLKHNGEAIMIDEKTFDLIRFDNGN